MSSESPKTKTDSDHTHIGKWLFVSVSIHLLVIVLLGEIISLSPHTSELEQQDIQSDSETPFSVKLSPPESQEEPEENQEDEVKDKQFITMPPPEEEETPEKARFRDQFESKSDKQQVEKSPKSTTEPSPPAPAPKKQPQQPKPTKAAKKKKKETKPEKEKSEKESETAPQQKDNKDTEKAKDDSEYKVKSPEGIVKTQQGDESEEKKESQTSQGSEKREPELSELLPSIDDGESQAQPNSGGGSVDYLKDIPEGEKTLLNRKKSRYWSFFNRIKGQIAQNWEPVDTYMDHDPSGEIYGVEDRYSQLHVTLESDGTLRKLYLSKPSGLDFLDDEAIRAIKKASPFRNPPEGLKDQDGLIEFSFGFYLDLKRGTFRSLRLRRR